MTRSSIIVLLCVLTTSCQTTKKLDSKTIPITLRPQFSLCYPLDGVLAAKLFENQSPLGSGELVWSQNLRREFSAQLVTSFGNSLATAKIKNSDIQIQSQILRELPPLTLDGEKIIVDGYFSGLLVSEIGCFLSGKLPFAWQEQMVDFRQKGNETEIDFQVDDRTVHTKVIGHSSLCTQIVTSYYFGFKKNEVTVCTDKTNLLKIVIRSGSFELSLDGIED